MRLLDHPLSRMMTAVSVGTALTCAPNTPIHFTTNYPFITVVIFAAHHMIIIIQRRPFSQQEN
jgi:hypothetical protein